MCSHFTSLHNTTHPSVKEEDISESRRGNQKGSAGEGLEKRRS
jgi:hypothetical protein